jgi:hypothetical protein
MPDKYPPNVVSAFRDIPFANMPCKDIAKDAVSISSDQWEQMEGFQVQKTSYIRVVGWWDGEVYRMMVCLVGRRLGLKWENVSLQSQS